MVKKTAATQQEQQKLQNQRQQLAAEIKEKIERSQRLLPTEKAVLNNLHLDISDNKKVKEELGKVNQYYNEVKDNLSWRSSFKRKAKKTMSILRKSSVNQAGAIIATNTHGIEALSSNARRLDEKAAAKETRKRRGQQAGEVLNSVGSAITAVGGSISKFKKGDPLNVISGTLDIVGSIAQFLPPPASTIVGGVVGVINGVMGLLGSPAAPSDAQVIGEKINEQTEILKGAIDKQTEILLEEFKSLSKLNVRLTETVLKEIETSSFLNLIDDIQGALQLLKTKQEHMEEYRTSCIENWTEIALEADTQELTQMLGRVASATYRFCSSAPNLAFCGRLLFQYTLLSIFKHRVHAEVINIVRQSDFHNSQFKVKGLLASYETAKTTDRSVLETLLYTPENRNCLITCAFHSEKYANTYAKDFEKYDSENIGITEDEKKIIKSYIKRLGIPEDTLEVKATKNPQERDAVSFCKSCYYNLPCNGTATPGPGETGTKRGGKDGNESYCKQWKEKKLKKKPKLCATVHDANKNNPKKIYIEDGKTTKEDPTSNNDAFGYVEVETFCNIEVFTKPNFGGTSKIFDKKNLAAPYYLGGWPSGWKEWVYSYKCNCRRN